MKLNWNFLGGGGKKQKTFRGGECGYFVELHNICQGFFSDEFIAGPLTMLTDTCRYVGHNQ